MVGYDPNSSHESSRKNQIMAGAGSGFLTRFLCQPFDVIKIRFQLQIEPIKKSSQISKYRSIFQAVTDIASEEGFFALWKGHVPAQALSITYSVIQFSTYELYTKNAFQLISHGTIGDSYIYFACGAMSGCSATLIAYPFDVIRTRLIAQSEPKCYNSSIHAFKAIISLDGNRGLYRGLVPTLLQIAPYAGAQFGIYHFCNNLWSKTFGNPQILNHSSSLNQTLITGAISGIAAKTLTYPLDFVKKRLQVQGFEYARRNFGAFRRYNGAFDCIVKVWREERFAALYKGLSPSLIKAAVTTALNFTFYEQIIRILSQM